MFVLLDPATGRTRTSDAERAARRFLPASTFKLYNALVALDAGVVTDVDSVWAWDGVERSIPAWNRDHTLRSGMVASTVWLYQRLATRVGRDRYAAAFAREPYGNSVMGDSLRWFWLDNSLQISANEEVRFVDRLRTGATGFSDDAERAVRGIVPVLAERAGAHGPVRLVAKTGWGGDAEMGIPDLGWIVGWVERDAADGGPIVFALNVEADPASAVPFDMGPARLRIVEAILTAEDILPRAD
ncbi:MAG TPA: penicillin-binding transpeptidase domain-containing protein [Rubricoccaceae bacterium]